MDAAEIWRTVDYWPLYVGHFNIARYMAILDIVKSASQAPGHFAEFGVFRGANLLFMAKVLKVLDPHSCREVFGFDSFEGLTTFTEKDRDAKDRKGHYAGSYETLMAAIEMHELQDDVTVVKGLIQDTLPVFLNERPEARFSLIFCDTDLYEPTARILMSITDRLSIGGYLVFDEWNHPDYPGETLAVDEFLRTTDMTFDSTHPSNTRNPTLIMKRTS